MIEEIRELYEYNRWANQRLLDAAAKLTPDQLGRDLGGSFPSLRDTLIHIVGADWTWLSRWNGVSPTAFPDGAALVDLDMIRRRWDEVEEERSAFLAGLTVETLQATLHYRTFAGVEASNPLWQLLRHVVNHATYHRGQVSHMLRQLGMASVSTDLVFFYRERQK